MKKTFKCNSAREHTACLKDVGGGTVGCYRRSFYTLTAFCLSGPRLLTMWQTGVRDVIAFSSTLLTCIIGELTSY